MNKSTKSLYNLLKTNHYNIYEHPLDAPNQYVVRRFEILPGQVIPQEALYTNTLEQARDLVPKGLVRVPRSKDDPPFFVETWL